MKKRQDDMQELQHKGTGAWFLGSDQFKVWKETPGSLWIQGDCESLRLGVVDWLTGYSRYREKCIEVLYILLYNKLVDQ
jgi:hypothetical protein